MKECAVEPLPLVVDVDGTLAATDLLWEGLVRVVFARPHRIPVLVASLPRGRARFKARVAQEARLDLKAIPLREDVVRRIDEARAAGRRVILASAAHVSQVQMLADRVGADEVLASSNENNLKGDSKLDRLRSRADEFEYIGDATVDLPLLLEARRSVVVDPSPWLRWKLRGSTSVDGLEVMETVGGGRLRIWLDALRVHQWAKNALLVLPLMAAHLTWTPELALSVAGGFGAFSLLASSIYLLNDLSDLPADRAHPTKRRRPLARGQISIPTAFLGVVVLIGTSVFLTTWLPVSFSLTLGVYLALNLGYSWGLKRIVVLDVVILAALYTVRVVAGATLAEIALTDWFLAFSVFFFLSLAVLKRVVELELHGELAQQPTDQRRPYEPADVPVLRTVGLVAGILSALVFCLYITGPVRQLYTRPELLWAGLPLFLYWVVRIWLIAMRGEVEEDPVVFVLRDAPSYLVLAAFLAVVYVAG